jgi:hypothetical protein
MMIRVAALIVVAGLVTSPIKHRHVSDGPGAGGYQLVFNDDFTDVGTIDVNNSGVGGYNWCMDKQFWAKPSAPNSVAMTPDGLVLSASITTACLSGVRGSPMQGRAWGGGAYFEAAITFNPGLVIAANGDWPAFVGLSWEMAGDRDQAAKQPSGYVHYGELDVMEYGFFNYAGQPPNLNYYWQTLHDFYGYPVSGTLSPPQIENNNVSAISASPGGIAGPHRYGALWISGRRNRPGSVQAYFDGVPMGGPVTTGLVTWPGGKGNVTPPTDETVFSIFDLQHFFLGLQGSAIAPITVRNVQVWQTTAGNMLQQ